MDCGWNPNVIYTGKTIVFGVLSPPWIPGHSYYITFDSGKDFLLFSILHID
jgi:archaellum component FlaF (FlaF/FlaG flagellin family)